MTAALVESVSLARGTVVPWAWMWNLAAWQEQYPKVADPISKRVFPSLRHGMPWWQASAIDYFQHGPCTGHDPLLRNGIIPSIYDETDAIFHLSWVHTALTHWSAMNVLCSALHGWIVHHLANERLPFNDGDDWLHRFVQAWLRWADGESDPPFRRWYSHPTIRDALTYSIRRLLDTEFDPTQVRPTRLVPCDTRRNVLKALQHAIWLTRIALEYEVTRSLSRETYWQAAGKGAAAIHTIARLGSNAAALGAIAGPMITSATAGQLPRRLVQHLSIFDSKLVFRPKDKREWLGLLCSQAGRVG